MKKIELNRKKYTEIKKMDHQSMTEWANDVFAAGYEMGCMDSSDEKRLAEVKAEGVKEFLDRLAANPIKGIGKNTLDKLAQFAAGIGCGETTAEAD